MVSTLANYQYASSVRLRGVCIIDTATRFITEESKPIKVEVKQDY